MSNDSQSECITIYYHTLKEVICMSNYLDAFNVEINSFIKPKS